MEQPVVQDAISEGEFAVSLLGMDVDGEPSFDTWQAFGRVLLDTHNSVQWALGDWLNYGEARYGEKYSQALDMTKRSYDGLRKLASVAVRFPRTARHPNLSWSHHAEVAYLSDAQAEDWLAQCETQQWSRDDLRAHLRTPVPPDLAEVIERAVRAVTTASNKACDPEFIAKYVAPHTAALLKTAARWRDR